MSKPIYILIDNINTYKNKISIIKELQQFCNDNMMYNFIFIKDRSKFSKNEIVNHIGISNDEYSNKMGMSAGINELKTLLTILNKREMTND